MPRVRTVSSRLKGSASLRNLQAAFQQPQRKAWQEAIPPAVAWREWEVPFDTDPDWPAPLTTALTTYRAAWRAKMDEVNAAIAANAEQEELVDRPLIVRGIVRVSGPFTKKFAVATVG